MFKKYWDILSGILTGVVLAFLANFKLDNVQLCYSVIILILVCIGIFRVIKQAIEKQLHTKARERTLIDAAVDSQKPIKAVNLAETPTEEGEKIGNLILNILRGTVKTMKNFTEKLKTFWSKFKGIMLAIALAILTIVEICAEPINALCGGVLTIYGIEVIPLVTLVCALVVGIISNPYSKEQRERIKALLNNKTPKNEIIKEEIKATLKAKKAELAQYNKDLVKHNKDLAQYEKELAELNETLKAKREMLTMIPQLATAEDVNNANNAVVNCSAKIADTKTEIARVNAVIETLTTTINALKSQL